MNDPLPGIPAVEVRDLRVTFDPRGRSVQALKGITLALGEGEGLAVVGESGSGKSTLGLALGGLLPGSAAVEGSIRLRGREFGGARQHEWGEVRGKGVGWVFQDPASSLNPARGVGRQLLEVVKVHRSDLADPRAHAVGLLDEVGFPDPVGRWDDLPGTFSGGQLQRLALALALAPDPWLLVADEPTTALDVTLQAKMLRLLAEVRARRRLAVVLITHNLGIVRSVATRIAVMRHGEIVEQGDLLAVLRSPAHPYTRELLAALPAGRLRGAGEPVEAGSRGA